MYKRTAVGGDDFGRFLKLVAAGAAGYALIHALNTKQWQTWHTLALGVGLISAISDL
jgi:hypothetical protein